MNGLVGRVGRAAAIAAFSLGYGWILFGAISNLVALPALYSALGIAESTPWAVLVAGVVLPVAFNGGALVLGRGRPFLDRILILTAGLAAASATALGSVGVVSLLAAGG